MIRLGTPLMTGQQGILFTILTCMTFSTQIHVLFQRVKTERGMCRACCEGIQTPNALVPLTNANSFHLHSTRATPSNTHTHTHTMSCLPFSTSLTASQKKPKKKHLVLPKTIITTSNFLPTNHKPLLPSHNFLITFHAYYKNQTL